MRIKFLCVLLVAVCSGCAQKNEPLIKMENQIAISSVRDYSTVYPKATKFKVVPRYVDSKTLPDEVQKSIYRQFQAQIENTLQAWGYELANNDEQEVFYIRFAIALSSDVNDELIGKHFGITPGLHQADNMEKGSLFMAIHDKESQLRIWRATAQGIVQNTTDEERLERIKNVVSSVLRQFFVTS